MKPPEMPAVGARARHLSPVLLGMITGKGEAGNVLLADELGGHRASFLVRDT